MIVPRSVPFEDYKWIANSFEISAWEDARFYQMIEALIGSASIVIIPTKTGPIVVTWKKPLHA